MQHTKQSTSQPLLLTIKDIMGILQLGRTKIYELIKGEGLPVQHFGRAVRIRPEALEAWLKARERQDNV